MSLAKGTGPLSHAPAGTANYRLDGPAHRLYLEPSPRRLRAELADETVVDSVRAHLLHESGHVPVYYVPVEDVRADVLKPSETTTHCPFKGDARYWDAQVGDRHVPDAVWAYPDPNPDAPQGLSALCAPAWAAMDRWFEEDVEVFVHPRDPYVRLDALDSRRHVVVRAGGEVLGDTRGAVALFETGLPTRWYLPPADVATERLVRSGTTTACPYKGVAGYYSVADMGAAGHDLVWCYPDPHPEVEALRDRLCLAQEADGVELTTDP